MNNSSNKLAVVIPVFNERVEVLNQVLIALKKHSFDVILVDDGSIIPVSIQANHIIANLRHEKNRGQGAALNTGTLKAYQLGYDYCAHFDGDGQHNSEDLQKMMIEMQVGKTDIIMGSRFLLEETGNSVPMKKKLILKGGVVLNYFLSGVWLSDSNCGIRMLNRKAMEKLVFKANRMAHASELVWLIKRHGLRFKEIPVKIEYTDYSKRKGQNLMRLFPVTWEVIKTYIKFKFNY